MTQEKSDATSGVSRRRLMQGTLATAGAALLGGLRAAGQSGAVLTNTQSGRRFKAWISHGWGKGPNSTTFEELRLLPIDGRQLVVRTEASQLCYTCAGRVMGLQPAPQGLPANDPPEIQGHGAIGIVEAIGPEVRRVRVGDRVVVNVLASCGRCYGCVTGRRRCQAARPGPTGDLHPFAETNVGTKVVQWANVGGFAELIVPFEESVIPVATDVPPTDLALLHCVAGCALGMVYHMGVDHGSDVVVFGAGPVGLSAIQGARILGAQQVISVEPVRARRELALRLGATAAVNPNLEGENLVPKLRGMCPGPSVSFDAGGLIPGRPKGPDYVIEAMGHPFVRPQHEAGQADTIRTLQQIWELTPDGGKLYTSGVGFPPGTTLALNPFSLMDASKTHFSRTNGSSRPLRDIPRNVSLIERGLFNAQAMVTSTPSLEQLQQAYDAVLQYTTISSVMAIT
jgi:S-(hydroxymethyl)glutathione dehydrogenase/alcohol dehydrogenase